MHNEVSGRPRRARERPSVRVIFIHHSTGRILLREGRVRDLVAERNSKSPIGIELWDHDYNEIGLTGPSGERTGISYDLPDNNTNPDGFELLFSQPVHDSPDNAFSHLLKYDVIVFKPCFPVCAIRSYGQLEAYRRQYRAIGEAIAQHPSKLFIAMTPPPLAAIPLVGSLLSSSEQWTNGGDARRAREFAEWLVTGDFATTAGNLAAFDLYDLLATPPRSHFAPNTLRSEYRSGKRGVLGLDSHPNARAAWVFAPAFVDFLFEKVNDFVAHSEVPFSR